MAAPIVVPFNNNPSSISVKTTSYTIPAGKYAQVNAINPDLTIDTIAIYPSRAVSFSGNNSSAVATSIFFSSPVYIASPSITVSGTPNVGASLGTILMGSNAGTFAIVSMSRAVNSVGTTVGTPAMSISPNIFFSATVGSTSSAQISIACTIIAFSGERQSTWVKSGTVLNGTNYLVTEYNQIS